jgi:hypothetical protein
MKCSAIAREEEGSWLDCIYVRSVADSVRVAGCTEGFVTRGDVQCGCTCCRFFSILMLRIEEGAPAAPAVDVHPSFQ